MFQKIRNCAFGVSSCIQYSVFLKLFLDMLQYFAKIQASELLAML